MSETKFSILDFGPSFNGIDIVESIYLTKPYEDWSEVRSPGRARRRMKRGFKQNIRIVQVPDPSVYVIGNKAHMHPDTARSFRERLDKVMGDKIQRDIDRAIRGMW